MVEEITYNTPEEEIIVLTTEVPDTSSVAAPATAPAGAASAIRLNNGLIAGPGYCLRRRCAV